MKRKKKTRKQRERKIWISKETYECHADYVIPDCWKYKIRTTSIADSEEWFECSECNIADDCLAGVHILYHAQSEAITVFHSTCEHEHSKLRPINSWGIDSVIKNRIDNLYNKSLGKSMFTVFIKIQYF